MILTFLLSVAAFAAPSAEFLRDLEIFKSRSLLIRSDREQLDANSTTTASRFLQWTPKLSAGLGKARERSKSSVTSVYDDTNYWYWRANADWNLFRGGSDILSWQAARANEEAQRYQVESRELKIELSGAQAIFRRLNLQDTHNAQMELLKLKQETMRIGRDRYRQGKISLQEVSKMEVDLTQQQNIVRQSEIDLAENEVSYRSYFVDSLQTNQWPLSESQGAALNEGSGSLDTKRSNSLASSAKNTWRASRSMHLPSIDMNISFREYPIKGPRVDLWSGTLELSIPFWSRLETASDSAQAYAASVKAENEAITAAREESLRREFLQKKIGLSLANLKEARVNLEKSSELYRDMLRSFQLGRLSTNDLFLEQDRKVRALLLYSSSRLSYHESLMEACALWGLSARDCLR